MKSTEKTNFKKIFNALNQKTKQQKEDAKSWLYLLRLADKHENKEEAIFLEKIIKAFSPCKNKSRRESEIAGYICAALPAFDVLGSSRVASYTRYIAEKVNPVSKVFITESGELCPDVLKYCLSFEFSLNPSTFLHVWIKEALTQGISSKEIADQINYLSRLEKLLFSVKKKYELAISQY